MRLMNGMSSTRWGGMLDRAVRLIARGQGKLGGLQERWGDKNGTMAFMTIIGGGAEHLRNAASLAQQRRQV
jgi:hypothetical protein